MFYLFPILSCLSSKCYDQTSLADGFFQPQPAELSKKITKAIFIFRPVSKELHTCTSILSPLNHGPATTAKTQKTLYFEISETIRVYHIDTIFPLSIFVMFNTAFCYKIKYYISINTAYFAKLIHDFIHNIPFRMHEAL